jgi:TonB family protein
LIREAKNKKGLRVRAKIGAAGWLVRVVVVAGILLCGEFRGTAMAQEKGATEATTQANAAAAVSYPDTANGLEHLVNDLFRALKDGDAAKFDVLVGSLAEPVSADWFMTNFGEDGYAMAEEYARDRGHLRGLIAEYFRKRVADKYTSVLARKNQATCDDNSGEEIYPVMLMRQQPVALYELRLHRGEEFFRLWAIAYVGGGFRFVGNLRPPDFPKGPLKKTAPSGTTVEGDLIRIDKNVQAAKLINKVQPTYPPKARDERLQGTVRLHVIIGADGHISRMRIEKAYCSLGEAAVKAVKDWRYSPTLLGGQPVAVDSTIDVIYSLR